MRRDSAGGGVIGGRGVFARRRGTVVVRRREVKNSTTGGTGGGGESSQVSMTGGGGDTPNLSHYDIVKFTYNSPNSGSMTVKDADGNLHSTTQVESGSTRTSYIFDNFVLKFEGLKRAGFPGQNEADARAYKSIPEENRKYFTSLLTENRAMELNVNGTLKKVQVIAAERATPYAKKLSETTYGNLHVEFMKVIKNGGGKSIKDVRFPANGGKGYNMYFVKSKGGNVSFKIFDYAFQHIRSY